MKNASLILNVVLLIAVAILYFLHFSGKSPATDQPAEVAQKSTNSPSSVVTQIAYVNSDSLLLNYDYYKDTKKELEEKRKKLEEEIGGKARAYENEVIAYQKKGNTLTLEQAQLTEQNLMRKQQDLVQYRDRVGQNLAKEEQEKNEELITNITKYLEQYTKDKNYKYILGYTKGGGVWYANDSLEITNDVLKGLNQQYSTNKTGSTDKK